MIDEKNVLEYEDVKDRRMVIFFLHWNEDYHEDYDDADNDESRAMTPTYWTYNMLLMMMMMFTYNEPNKDWQENKAKEGRVGRRRRHRIVLFLFFFVYQKKEEVEAGTSTATTTPSLI